MSSSGQISKYLKVVAIEGKGLGTVATQDIEPYTCLLSESPIAIVEETFRDLAKDKDAIATAYRALSPGNRARFDALHEAPLPLETREMRIWTANSLVWDPRNANVEIIQNAVFLNMSRVNHACVPNANYRVDKDEK